MMKTMIAAGWEGMIMADPRSSGWGNLWSVHSAIHDWAIIVGGRKKFKWRKTGYVHSRVKNMVWTGEGHGSNKYSY